MAIHFNKVGSTGDVGAVNGSQQVGNVGKINTVFGVKKGDSVPSTPFNDEEQQILGIFASVQDFVLNED